MANNIFKNIKSIASEKNLSFFSIEKKCGLGNGTISGWETSKPRIDNLEKVANVLECSIADLMKE